MKPPGHPILFIDHATGLGGAENSLLLLLKHLDRNVWEPHVVGQPGRLLTTAQKLDLPTHPLPLPRLRRSANALSAWGQGILAIRRIARQIDAAAIYANTVRAAFYAAPAARLSGHPFVWHMRDFWLSENKPDRPQVDERLKRMLQSLSAVTIANSQATAAFLPLPDRVKVVPNGLDLAEFEPRPAGGSFRTRFEIPLHAPLVGMAGRLRPWKGQQRFIELARTVADRNPHTHFVVIGGNPFGDDNDDDGYIRQLHEQVARLALGGRVHFTGQISPIADPLAELDLFIHPGDPEPFGLVNIEAMAMGKPVVAFNHGALPEIVQDGETGRLVPPFDIEQMGKIVLHLLDQPEIAQTMGQHGRRRVENRFTANRVAADVSQILASLINHGVI